MLAEAPWAGGGGDRGLLGFGCGQLAAGRPICWQKTKHKLEITQARARFFSLWRWKVSKCLTPWFIHVRQEKKSKQVNSIAVNITQGFQLLRVAAKYTEIQNKLREQCFTQQIFIHEVDPRHTSPKNQKFLCSQTVEGHDWKPEAENILNPVQCQLYTLKIRQTAAWTALAVVCCGWDEVTKEPDGIILSVVKAGAANQLLKIHQALECLEETQEVYIE